MYSLKFSSRFSGYDDAIVTAVDILNLYWHLMIQLQGAEGLFLSLPLQSS